MTKKILLPFIALLLLASCTTTYVVNSVNTPLLDHKGEIQAGANYKNSEFFVFSLEPQAAYAVTDHIGIMYSGSYAVKNASNIDPGSLYNKRNFSEIGVGYYKKFTDHFQYEVYGGYGYGNIKDRVKSSENDTIILNTATYNRYFLQPTIGYVNPHFNMAFTPRMVYVDYIRNNSDTPNFMAIEPVLSFQFGSKLIFLTQIGASLPTQNYKADYNPVLMSFGIKYRFGRN